MLGLKEGDYLVVGGILVGIGILWALQKTKSNLALSYATAVDCASLCASKNCSEYNCKCTKGCDVCGGAAAVGDCGDGPNPPQTSPPSGDGGGSGSRWFFASGSTAKMGNARCSKNKCGAGSGSSSGGNRWETVKSGWMDGGGLEVVIYFTIKKGSMCKGGHIGLKHGGPEHKGECSYKIDGSCCCWWDCGIDNDAGKAYVEIERPHPNNMNRKYYGNVGTKLDSGQPIGVRWLIAKEGKGVRLKQWVDISGKVNGYKWTKTYDVLDTGQFMPTSYYSKITKIQNVEIRISDVNCNDIKVHNAETRKFSGSSSKYAVSYPAFDKDEMRPLYNERISMA